MLLVRRRLPRGVDRKGGRARWIPVLDEGQRPVLDEARRLAGCGSLTRESCVTLVRIDNGALHGGEPGYDRPVRGKRSRMFRAVGYEAPTVSAQAAISARPLSMRSLLAYARSTALPTVCARRSSIIA